MYKQECRKKHHEFQIDHDFGSNITPNTKLLEARWINTENLIGHSMRISDSYYRPAENEFLDDYLKAAPLLTITETVSFYKKTSR